MDTPISGSTSRHTRSYSAIASSTAARKEAQPASAISVPIIGTSRAICVAFSGESEARAFLEQYAGGGVLQLPAPDNITITFVALDATVSVSYTHLTLPTKA